VAANPVFQEIGMTALVNQSKKTNRVAIYKLAGVRPAFFSPGSNHF
jgi:hypothetical protein